MWQLIKSVLLNLLNAITHIYNRPVKQKTNKEMKKIDIKKLRIQFFKSGVRNDIEEFKYHVVGIENHFKTEVNNLIDYHERATSDLSDEEKNEYFEFYSDGYWWLEEVFPQIQRKSELIGIFTVLEHNLNLLCSIYQKHIDSNIKLSDLRAEGIIDTAKKYLEKVVGLNFPSNHRSWSEIKRIQRIRNLFVHNDGKLKGSEKDKKSIKDYIKRLNYLDLDQYERILIKQGFTVYCLDQFRELFDELFKSVEEFENQSNN